MFNHHILVDLVINEILDSPLIQQQLAAVKKSHLNVNNNLHTLLERYSTMAIYHLLEKQGVKNVAQAIVQDPDDTLDKAYNAINHETLLKICAHSDFELKPQQLHALQSKLREGKTTSDITVENLCEHQDNGTFVFFKSQSVLHVQNDPTLKDALFKFDGKFSYFYPQNEFNHGEAILKFVDLCAIANIAIAYRIKFAAAFVTDNKKTSALDAVLKDSHLAGAFYMQKDAATAFTNYIKECQGQRDNLIARLKSWSLFKAHIRRYLGWICYLIELIYQICEEEEMVGFFTQNMKSPFNQFFNAAQYLEAVEAGFIYEDNIIAAHYFNMKLPKAYINQQLDYGFWNPVTTTSYYVYRLGALFAPTFEHEQDISYAALDMKQVLSTIKTKLSFMFEGHLPDIELAQKVSFEKLHLYLTQFLINLYIQGLSKKLLAEKEHLANKNNNQNVEVRCWFPLSNDNETMRAAFEEFQKAYHDELIQKLFADYKGLDKAYNKLEMVSYSEKEKISAKEKRHIDKFILKAKINLYQELATLLEDFGVLLSDAKLSLSNSADDSSRNYNASLKEIYKYLYSYCCYFLIKNKSYQGTSFNGFSSEESYRQFLPQIFQILESNIRHNIVSFWGGFSPLRSIIFSSDSFCDYQQFENNLRAIQTFSVASNRFNKANFSFLVRVLDPRLKQALHINNVNFQNIISFADIQNNMFEWLIKEFYSCTKSILKAILNYLAQDIYTAKTQKAVKPYLSDLFAMKQMLKNFAEINLAKFEGILEANFKVLLTDSIVKHPEVQAFLTQLLESLQNMSHSYDNLNPQLKASLEGNLGCSFAQYLYPLLSKAQSDLLGVMKKFHTVSSYEDVFDHCSKMSVNGKIISLSLIEEHFAQQVEENKDSKYDYVNFATSIFGEELASIFSSEEEDELFLDFFRFFRKRRLSLNAKTMLFVKNQLEMMERDTQETTDQPTEDNALTPSKSSARRSRRTSSAKESQSTNSQEPQPFDIEQLLEKRAQEFKAAKQAEQEHEARKAQRQKAKSQAPSEDQPKPKRTRRTKAQIEADKAAAAAAAQAEAKSKSQAPSEDQPKPKRTRRTKAQIEADKAAAAAQAEAKSKAQAPSEDQPKPKRTRRTKAQIEADKAAAAGRSRGSSQG